MSAGPVRTRRTARVLLVDGADRFLLFRFVPDGMPAFWMLPGGECEAHEDFAAAARRELFEETGIRADPRPLAPERRFHYRYEGAQVLGIEHLFHWRTRDTRIDTSGHTPLERERMQRHRWFALEDLADWDEPVWPRDIAELIALAGGAAAA